MRHYIGNIISSFIRSFSYIVFGLFILTLSSCEKYLDIKRTNSQRFIESADDCQLVLNNYNIMNTGYPCDGEVSADNYYLSGVGFLSNTLSAADRDLYAWLPQAIRPGADTQWQTPYRVIYHANLVLENLDHLKGAPSQAIINDLRGQCLFFRAYALWQVAQLYAKPYTTNLSSQEIGVPIRVNSDISVQPDRASLQETYTRILGDLKDATNLINTSSQVASRPNRVAVYAMLARVYLSMGEYDLAFDNANLALQINSQLIDYNSISTTSTTPFERFNKEVIFHSIMSAGPTLNPGDAANPISRVDDGLYQSYKTNDLRKSIFYKANTLTVSLDNVAYITDPTKPQKVDVTLPDGTYRFSGNYEPAANANLFNGLAVDEIFLIRSECYARAGNVSSALGDLNTLLSTRWKNTSPYQSVTAVNSDDALAKVLEERRKELIMRGQRWTDLRRLNIDSRFKKDLVRQTKTVNFTGNNINPVRTETIDATYTLPANDIRYTLLIPQAVVDFNYVQQNSR